MEDKNKEEFEIWWNKNGPDLSTGTAYYAAAMAWQAARSSIKDTTTKAPEVKWDIELMYKHRGERLPRFMSLGISKEKNHLDAIEYGRNKGKDWLEQQFKGNEIESWDVKVRPAKC